MIIEQDNKYIPPTKNIPTTIWNRRYSKLQRLINDSTYFDEEEVRMREPLLYFLYVGQYKRNADKQMLDQGFYEFLMEDLLTKKYCILNDKHDYPELFSEKEISQEELEENEDEMLRLLHDKFMEGLNQDFDYEQIDYNEEFDDIKTIKQDQEDSYFDQEQASEAKEMSEYTGIQDY